MYNDMGNGDHLITYLPIHQPTHPSTYVPTYLPTHPPIYLPIYPTICFLIIIWRLA
jgi:hypothetical protein